jgi:hypothetical protein
MQELHKVQSLKAGLDPIGPDPSHSLVQGVPLVLLVLLVQGVLHSNAIQDQTAASFACASSQPNHH